MRRLFARMDAVMVAITFAEAGEAETARRMIADARRDEDCDEDRAEAWRRPARG